jgi:tetratricopeptide (TPR) repeat protein
MRFLLTLIVLAAPLREPENSWAGKIVMVKKTGVRITYADEKGGQRLVVPAQMDFRVLADQQGRIQVRSQLGLEGWFDKTDLVLLEDAAAWYSEALRHNPKDAATYHLRARARHLQGALDLAIEDFAEAIRLAPSAALYNNRANVWLAKKDFDKAVADYDHALKLSPRSSAFFNNRGNVWSAKKDYDRAIADYDQAIRLSPKAAPAYANRALAWNRKKEYDKALADCDECIRLDPFFLSAYSHRGTAWSAKNEHDKAIADFSKVLRLDPKNVLAYRNRGKAWVAKKDHDRAIADFSQAIAFDAKNVLARDDRGRAYYEKKDYENAMADYNEAIRLDPKLAAAYSNRAWLWATCPDAKFRDGQRALESARKAVDLFPKNAGFLDTLAAAYAETGNFEEAVRCQERALESPQLTNDTAARLRLELYRKKQPYRQE